MAHFKKWAVWFSPVYVHVEVEPPPPKKKRVAPPWLDYGSPQICAQVVWEQILWSVFQFEPTESLLMQCCSLNTFEMKNKHSGLFLCWTGGAIQNDTAHQSQSSHWSSCCLSLWPLSIRNESSIWFKLEPSSHAFWRKFPGVEVHEEALLCSTALRSLNMS